MAFQPHQYISKVREIIHNKTSFFLIIHLMGIIFNNFQKLKSRNLLTFIYYHGSRIARTNIKDVNFVKLVKRQLF